MPIDEWITGPNNEWDTMYKKLTGLKDSNIQIIWDALNQGFDLTDFYAPGITMADWQQAVYSEMDKRGMSHVSAKLK